MIAASTLVGMCINFTKINPIPAPFWTGVLNGFLAPPLLVLVMMVSCSRKIMEERANGTGMKVLGWLATALMFVSAIALIVTWNQ